MPSFINAVISATLSPTGRGDGKDCLTGKGKGVKHLLDLFVSSSENAVLELDLQNQTRVYIRKQNVFDSTTWEIDIQ